MAICIGELQLDNNGESAEQGLKSKFKVYSGNGKSPWAPCKNPWTPFNFAAGPLYF